VVPVAWTARDGYVRILMLNYELPPPGMAACAF
jgi:hypothetical protein